MKKETLMVKVRSAEFMFLNREAGMGNSVQMEELSISESTDNLPTPEGGKMEYMAQMQIGAQMCHRDPAEVLF